MKKLLRLMTVPLASSLMFIFFNAILAGLPVSARQADDSAVPLRLTPWNGYTPAGQTLLARGAITGLTITHSSPAVVNFSTRFTATIASGALPLLYAWSWGDNTALPPELSQSGTSTKTHIYNTPGTYTVIVTASNIESLVSQTISLTVGTPERIYVPLVFKDFIPPVPLADLSCSLSIEPFNPSAGQTMLVTVQIQNQGQDQADGFWVDLYINPSTLPTPDNLFPWQDACGDPSSCSTGMAWGISNMPLLPGTSRTLISVPGNFHPDGYNPTESAWTGSLPAGIHNLYAYVDSIDNPTLANVAGGVRESNEANNRCEIVDLVVQPSGALEMNQAQSNGLPARSRP